MGLVVKDDGWRIPDWLWAEIEPLLAISQLSDPEPALVAGVADRWIAAAWGGAGNIRRRAHSLSGR